MKYGAAVGLMAFALGLPVFGQHSVSHGGFAGHSGFSGHSGSAGHSGFAGHAAFARHSGFSGSRSISRPSAPFRSGGFTSPGFRRIAPPSRLGLRVPYRGRGFVTDGHSHRPPYSDHFHHGWNHDRDRDRRHGGRFIGSYGYPGWVGVPYAYPYVIDPGFYNWENSDDSGYDQGGNADDQGGAVPVYADAAPDADYGATPPNDYAQAPPAYTQTPSPLSRQPYAGSSASVAVSEEQQLTVIFKDGRAPEKIQNYIMNSKSLTDLDRQRYEQIPLDEIDTAATERANRARGVDFKVPQGSKD